MVGRIAIALLLAAAPFDSANGLAQDKPARQAVIDTTAGTIVMDLLADKAPNHVALFIKTAQEGGYDGTTFFRMIKLRDRPGRRSGDEGSGARDKYGTGGLNLLKPEITDEKQTRGAVSATQIPGKPDSAGTQFFIAVTDQPGLDGKYTVFARVVDGLLVAQKISEAAVDDKGLAIDRVVVNKVTIRDKPADDARSRSRPSRSRSWRAIEPCSTPRWARSRCRSRPTRRPITCATSCGWRRRASTTA